MKCIFYAIFYIVFSITSLCAFADDNDPVKILTADMGYMEIPNLPKGGDKISPIRVAGLKQGAMTLGACGGLAWEANIIDHALEDESLFLDQAFDFDWLLLDHDVLPPVLTQSNNSLNLDNDDTLRIDEKTYRIVKPARFVTAPPNWRDYLWMRFDKPTTPDRSLLPQTRAEAQVWNYYLREGWKNGVLQAQAIFAENLNRLKRDMTGIVLYRILLAEHMVSAPFVAEAQMGVTGDANQLRINDEVLRITAQSQLQTNATKWKPVLTH